MLRSLLRRLTIHVHHVSAVLLALSAVACIGLIAGLLYNSNGSSSGQHLSFSVVRDDGNVGTFKAARILLGDPSRPRVSEATTNRSENYFWLLSDRITFDHENEQYIEFPSRHTTSIDYQFVDVSGEVVGEGRADRSSSQGNIRNMRAGFAISVPAVREPVQVVLRVKSSGPARLAVLLWAEKDLELVDQFFDRSGGVLFGSMLMIAAFSFLIALLARDYTFLLFGGWVVASLRLASYSAGWDMTWLGMGIVEEYPRLSRNIPLAAYGFLTVSLFWAIFKKDVARLGATQSIRIIFAASICLIGLAAAIPHKSFLPLLWGVVVPCIALLIVLTVRIYLRTGSASAAWYGASWIAALTGIVGDVAFAAGLTASKPALANSLASSVAASLLAGIAIAQRLKTERIGRLAAQRSALKFLGQYQSNYNSMPIGLFSLTPDGVVKLSNPAFNSMFEVEEHSIKTGAARFDEILRPGAFDLLASTKDKQEAEVEINVPNVSGGDGRWFLVRVSAKEDALEGSIQEITSRKLAEARLRHLVDHDSLTGVLNRRGLEQAMSEATELVNTGVACAVAHVAIDRFKLVNDLYGHGTGDAMLQNVAMRLQGAVRARDRIARLADSFVVVFMECPDFAVMGLSERLREAIGEAPFEYGGKRLDMTSSVGVVGFDAKMNSVDVLAAASRACAEAKTRGRNCVVRLDDGDKRLRSHLEELKVVADLQTKLMTDRYFLDFQPIVALQSPEMSLNYEVLLRMRDEQGNVVPPGKFIGAAERNGLMSDIDRWVLRNILEWLDANPEHRDRLDFATINISGASLNDSRFVDDAFSMIAEHPLAMPKLCFEITESVALNDIGSTRRFIDRVRMYGSKLALDDFGAGYTSFNYLKEIPADLIKIDGSFVKDINADPANYAITRTIVDLTHELGMRSIAEWAETADTVASLIELGVDYGQGYGLARPMDKRLVTAASSCAELVKDPEVMRLLLAGQQSFLSAQ